MPLKTMRAFFRHPAGRGVWLGMLCALIAWYVSSTLFRGLEDWMLDGCFVSRGLRETRANIVIIGLDEESLQNLRKPVAFASPELAQVVGYLKEQQVSAVGIDLYVPDAYSDVPEIKDSAGSGAARPLGLAISSAGNVVLPEWWSERGWLRPLHQWQSRGHNDLAFLNQTEDADHFVRRARMVRERTVPHFGLAVFARSQGADFTWDESSGELKVNGERIPLDEDHNLRINFVGPSGTFPVVPFGSVLEAAREKRALPEFHPGTIVLIGITAWTDQDLEAVPFNNNNCYLVPDEVPRLMAVTEIHANIISTLVDRAYIRSPPWRSSLPLLLVFGALLGGAYGRLSPGWGLLLAVAHHVAWKGIALAAFTYLSWRLEQVGMLLLGAAAYGLIYAARWRSLRRTLGVVKSDTVAKALEEDPRKLNLGGKECVVTVFFSDVRNFTSYSEEHTAKEVVSLLNAYYSAVIPVIEAEGGTVNTYMGDGIMVLFGAHVEYPDHALRAVRAAVAMVRKVRELKPTLGRTGLLGLPHRRRHPHGQSGSWFCGQSAATGLHGHRRHGQHGGPHRG